MYTEMFRDGMFYKGYGIAASVLTSCALFYFMGLNRINGEWAWNPTWVTIALWHGIIIGLGTWYSRVVSLIYGGVYFFTVTVLIYTLFATGGGVDSGFFIGLFILSPLFGVPLLAAVGTRHYLLFDFYRWLNKKGV